MAGSLKMTGFKELERKLAQLPASTAKGVTRRVLKKQLKPVAIMANAFWPGADDDVFRITSRIARGQMGDSHMRRSRSTVNMFVGAPGGANGTPEAHLIEFGTGPRFQKNGRYTGEVAPTPMLQPAWDAHKRQMLKQLGADMFEEIEKSLQRRAAKLAKQGG